MTLQFEDCSGRLNDRSVEGTKIQVLQVQAFPEKIIRETKQEK